MKFSVLALIGSVSAHKLVSHYDATPTADLPDTDPMECTNWKGEAKKGHACAQDQGTTPTKEYSVQLLSNLRYDATPTADLPDTDAMECTNWKGEAKKGHACAQDQGTTPTKEYSVQLLSNLRYDATPAADLPDTDPMECTNWKGETKKGHHCAQDQGTTPTKEYSR